MPSSSFYPYISEDLWPDIVDILASDLETLAVICTTSRLISRYCRQHLFKTIVLHIALGKSELHTRLLGLQECLSQRPELSNLIKTLSITISLESAWGPDDATDFPAANQLFREAFCPLLSLLKSLETLIICNDCDGFERIPLGSPELGSPEFFQSISSPRLSTLEFKRVTFNEVPLSFLRRFPNLQRLRVEDASVQIVPDVCQESEDREQIYLKSFAFVYATSHSHTYTFNRIYIQDLITPGGGISMDRLEHLDFSSSFEINHQQVSNILKRSSDTLKKITYTMPNNSAGGRHASLSSNILDLKNRPIFSTLSSLRHFEFRISAIDCLDDAAWTPQPSLSGVPVKVAEWMVNSCKLLDACPRLSLLEIKITWMFSPNLFSDILKRDWKTLDGLIGQGLLRSLKRIRFNLELSPWWQTSDPNYKDWLEFQPFLDEVFSSATSRGISVDVEHTFDKE
ncbi:hypothetical protein FA15DRAFT_672708 [Coprinopsis marcescibilis]|uniref:F-box domain-containing protein n=1 Tax=Coprinopsis marcescibilis TaxID=230819 RepID=A0A5C3KLN4_COPMA|nr:hypothetical protein FA15DRAFT_672708 [Coprinopsis marcescibilis]